MKCEMLQPLVSRHHQLEWSGAFELEQSPLVCNLEISCCLLEKQGIFSVLWM
jgi:hypothetical protein